MKTSFLPRSSHQATLFSGIQSRNLQTPFTPASNNSDTFIRQAAANESRFGSTLRKQQFSLIPYQEVQAGTRGNADNSVISDKYTDADVEASYTTTENGGKKLSIAGKAIMDYSDGTTVGGHRIDNPGLYPNAYQFTFERDQKGEFHSLHYSTTTEELRAYKNGAPNSRVNVTLQIQKQANGAFVASYLETDENNPQTPAIEFKNIEFTAPFTVVSSKLNAYKNSLDGSTYHATETVKRTLVAVPGFTEKAVLKLTEVTFKTGPDADKTLLKEVRFVTPYNKGSACRNLGTDSWLDLPVQIQEQMQNPSA